jgi:1,4-alpha-glucan branching enzyme
MGGEIGQTSEWSIERGIEWWLTDHPPHKGIQTLMQDLNAYYKESPALYEQQFQPEGFEWIEHHDNENSFLAYTRKGYNPEKIQLVICNLTPVTRENFRVGVPQNGTWKEVFNTDDLKYNGSGVLNMDAIEAEAIGWNGQSHSIVLTLPPLAMLAFALE